MLGEGAAEVDDPGLLGEAHDAVPSTYSSVHSRRSSHVLMMKPTDAWHFDDRSVASRLHSAWLGRVLAQR